MSRPGEARRGFPDAGLLRGVRAAQHVAHLVQLRPGSVGSSEVLTRYQCPDAVFLIADEPTLQFRMDALVDLRARVGRLPIIFPGFGVPSMTRRSKAGVGPLGMHTLRRTYRSWIDSGETAVAVQQKLMRHSDIRTMNVYGNVIDDRTKEAHGKVEALVFGDRRPRQQLKKSRIKGLAAKWFCSVFRLLFPV